MNKKFLIPTIVVMLLLIGGIAFLAFSLSQQKQANKDMQELAELDKKEMENEYQQFADQYSEMKTRINNDSIVAQLTQEQLKTQQLLQELKRVKSSDAMEIMRLKRELATVRKVLKSYILQIDSLNRINENLTAENTRIKGQYEESLQQIENINADRTSLSEKVAIASQLDATAIKMQLLKSNGKPTDRIKRCKNISVSFNIAKNVTTQSGMRTIYVRITTPSGAVLTGGGSFNYENRTMECTMKKTVEYGGQETPVTVYRAVGEYLDKGTYLVSIFEGGNMIGSRSFTFK